jgi:citrate lyase subunit alpha/citrate CoA-transferase
VLTIEHLHAQTQALSPVARPQAPQKRDGRIVGVVEYRDGSVIDVIRQVTA